METIKYLMALLGAMVGYVWGEIDGLFIALIIFIVVDYVTGVMLAIYERKLSSEVGFKGIFKKVLVLVLVAIANVIDSYILKSGSPCRTSVIFFYLSNEGISILENSASMGLPIPEKLRAILEQLHDVDNFVNK